MYAVQPNNTKNATVSNQRTREPEENYKEKLSELERDKNLEKAVQIFLLVFFIFIVFVYF